ncbi:hypothetical protein LY90DRAFT_519469 [Neocallimastix californiae]|uniref:Bulb-type lectin domain-containing protein n=1 Tax=Neocallimastix californiae TaxID=1754190 RepID=A0A1Y1Z181_9FUNG|nr:hypothetical protein LY90DRAFT_519469 [Neocallimastix californiae]|eukprot:ORY04040.1 hypothetical protein LY90DRAFT_519469 [Neocallimastix californiae]
MVPTVNIYNPTTTISNVESSTEVENNIYTSSLTTNINTSTPSTTSTTCNKSATSTTSTTSTTTNINISTDNKEYIIWDSLPKDLPFNVGFPDDKGYYLYIKDDKDTRVGASVVLYDGTGVKIWEVKGKQKDYKDYAFPVEYVYPLAIDTTLNINDEYYEYHDQHNFYDKKIVKDVYSSTIEMNCKNIINENEALISENKQYRFFIQETGNIVIKDNYRTTWSSNTANINIFEGSFKDVFSPLGEFILRDKYDYTLWKSINPILLFNNNDILSEYKFYLTLSNEAELFVEDQYHNIYWSNWNERIYNSHLRYVNSLKYEISSCNEHLRNKNIYEIFTETNLYNYYINPDDRPSLVKKYYFNNLLPGEVLLSDYNGFLNVTKSDLILNINDKPEIISSCSENKDIKELRLEVNGLKLYCNDGNMKYIAELKDNKDSKYNRLSVEYREGMEKPILAILT